MVHDIEAGGRGDNGRGKEVVTAAGRDVDYTPRPWAVECEPRTKRISGPEIWSGGVLVAKIPGIGEFDYENAAFIVKACNAYDGLLARAEMAREMAEALKRLSRWRNEAHEYDEDMGHEMRDFDVETVVMMEAYAGEIIKKWDALLSTTEGRGKP